MPRARPEKPAPSDAAAASSNEDVGDAAIDDEAAAADEEGDDLDEDADRFSEETGIDLSDASELDADNVLADEEFDRVMQAPD